MVTEFFGFFWDVVRKNLLNTFTAIAWVENSLELDISQGLVEIDVQVEFSDLTLDFGGAHDDVGFAFLKDSSSRVFSLLFDGRHELKFLRVEGGKVLLSLIDLKDSDGSIMELLRERIHRVLATNWKTASQLGQR